MKTFTTNFNEFTFHETQHQFDELTVAELEREERYRHLYKKGYHEGTTGDLRLYSQKGAVKSIQKNFRDAFYCFIELEDIS